MITLFENFYKKGLNIAYSGVIIDEKSRDLLLSTFVYSNPEFSDWIKIAHHLTICMGELPEHMKRYWLNQDVTLNASHIGFSDKSVAVKIDNFFIISKANDLETDGPKFPHITLAINPIDAKPSDSNQITEWQEIKHLNINGIIKEIPGN